MTDAAKSFSISSDAIKVQRILSLKSEVDEFHPLLERLLPKLKGIDRSENTHGNMEHGADFVMLKTDQTTGIPVYIGVVAKCGNINKPESHRVIDQVRECHGERHFLGGKLKIHLSEIWVVTTGMIAVPARQNIYDEFKASNVQFIQRDDIIRWIDNVLPRFWTDVDVVLSDYFTETLAKIQTEEKEFTLVTGSESEIYIEQDIIKFEDQRRPLKYFKRLPKAKSISVLEEIKEHSFILVQGEAGSGKSKYGRELVKQLCNGANFNSSGVIPMKISISEIFSTKTPDLWAFVENKLSKFQDLLDDKNTFLLIADGLDELKENAEEVSKKLGFLAEQAAKHSKIKILLLSRTFTSQYGDDVDTHGANELQLMPFSLSKTISFLKALCKNLTPSSRVFEDLKKSAIFQQLPKSPMAAILLARILKEDVRDLPSTLPELYRKYCELAMGMWDVGRGLMGQKEYDALNSILMEIAEYFMLHSLDEIGKEEAFGFFKKYLKNRNTGFTPEYLFNEVAARCPILRLGKQSDMFAFRHRTFVEFLFAKKVFDRHGSKGPLEKLDPEVFSPQWSNSLYFYVGLLRDCEDFLTRIIDLKPKSDQEDPMKVILLPDLLLAAYNTHYDVIERGIYYSATELSKIYIRIANDHTLTTKFKNLSKLSVLVMFAMGFSQRFSYDFFIKGIPNVVENIALSTLTNEEKAYAIYFLSIAYRESGGKDSFDFLLDNVRPLPLILDFIVAVEGKQEKSKSQALKKHVKHVNDSIKSNSAFKAELNRLLSRPLSSLLKEES